MPSRHNLLLLALLTAALLPMAVPVSADLRFCNPTQDRLGVAVGFKDKQGFVTQGWWNLPAKSCDRLPGTPIDHRYYLNVINYDRGGEWAGDTYLCTREKEFTLRGIEDCAARGYERTGFFAVDTGRAKSPAINVNCICTADYVPVCARKPDGRLETYSNACRAGCEGAKVVRKGKC